MAYTEYAINNVYEGADDTVPRWTCSWCQKAIVGVDQIYVGSMAKPFICTSCLAEALKTDQLVLREGTLADVNDSHTCYDCGDGIDIDNDAIFCESCKSSAYEGGLEDAVSTCSYCGDDSDVYCISHAKSEWELVELGAGDIVCDECGTDDSDTTIQFLCEDCLAKVSVPDVTYAQAAEPIDIDWGDEDD